MTEKLTDKLERSLKRMDSALDWRFGMAFRYYENRAAIELEKLDVKSSEYRAMRLRYSVLIYRAKKTGVIN